MLCAQPRVQDWSQKPFNLLERARYNKKDKKDKKDTKKYKDKKDSFDISTYLIISLCIPLSCGSSLDAVTRLSFAYTNGSTGPQA